MVQSVLPEINSDISIDKKEKYGTGFGYDRSYRRTFYSHLRETELTEYKDIIQYDIGNSHHYCIDRQDLGTCDADVQGTEHDIDKREEEPVNTPVQKLHCSIQYLIGWNHNAHDGLCKRFWKAEQHGGHHQ